MLELFGKDYEDYKKEVAPLGPGTHWITKWIEKRMKARETKVKVEVEDEHKDDDYKAI